MPTFKLTIEYEGTRYSGWQAQANTAKTVQGRLERAAREALGDAEIGGAGRTDAGVHAVGQVAHLRTAKRVTAGELQRSLNDLLPHDINVVGAEQAPSRFHARHDARARTYLYQISRRRTALAKPFVWWIRDRLDAAAIARAAERIEGKHDFGGFADKRAANESTLVVVEEVKVGEAGDLILVRITASHFLWKMVRKLVAALVEVGRGRLGREEIERRLRAGGPRFEPTAPPSGLFLERVAYEGDPAAGALVPIVPVGSEAEWPRANRS